MMKTDLKKVSLVLLGFVVYSVCFSSIVSARVPTTEEAIEILEAASASLDHPGPWEGDIWGSPPYYAERHGSAEESRGDISLRGCFYAYCEDDESGGAGMLLGRV